MNLYCNHEYILEGDRYKCKKCNKELITDAELKEYAENKKISLYRCPLCKSLYDDMNIFNTASCRKCHAIVLAIRPSILFI